MKSEIRRHPGNPTLLLELSQKKAALLMAPPYMTLTNLKNKFKKWNTHTLQVSECLENHRLFYIYTYLNGKKCWNKANLNGEYFQN